MNHLRYCVVGLVLAVGCDIQPARIERTSNPRVTVEVLFTDPEGCTVKRFRDGDHYHYYATPSRPAAVFRAAEANDDER